METQDSTAPDELAPTRMCLVYDRRNGRIVHVHAFVPEEPKDEMTDKELHDLALAAYVGNIPRDALAATTAPPEFLTQTPPTGKVDLASGVFVPTPLRTEDVDSRKFDPTSMHPSPSELPELAATSAACGKVWSGVIARLRIYDQPGSTGKKVFAYIAAGKNDDYVGASNDPNVIHSLFLARENGNYIQGYTNPQCRIEWLDY